MVLNENPFIKTIPFRNLLLIFLKFKLMLSTQQILFIIGYILYHSLFFLQYVLLIIILNCLFLGLYTTSVESIFS